MDTDIIDRHKKCRILQFPMTNAYSGVAFYVLENWRFIDKERFHFDYATLSKTKLFFEDSVTEQGCKVYHISCYAEENKQQFSKEVKEILSAGYDAVHLHTSYWKSFLVEELAREAGVPKIIIHSHNTSVLEGDRREERIAHHNQCVANLREDIATDYWACSRQAAKWLYGDSIPADRIVIQKNAIDIDKYRFNPETANRIKNELGWNNNYIIGHVGRFTYQKNHSFLIRVFRAVHKQNPNTRLLLIGFGPERGKVDQMIREWNLQDSIRIMERRNDVHELLQAIDCFVLPSIFEGFPIVLTEAQVSGCNCITSEAIIEEAILTKNAERLPLEENAWINMLKTLSEGKYRRQTNNAEVFVEQGYDLKDQIKIIEKDYLN